MNRVWKLLGSLCLLAVTSLFGAILAGVDIYPYTQIVRVLQVDTVATIGNRSRIETAFHTLKVTRSTVAGKVLANDGGQVWGKSNWGGGITAYGDDVIGVTNHGQFFLYETGADEPNVSLLDIKTNNNREDFVSHMEVMGLNTFNANRWFRHIDLLYVKDADEQSIFLSHLFWNIDSECYTLRISRLTFDGKQDLRTVSKSNENWDAVYDSKPCLKVGSNYYGLIDGGRMVLAPSGEIYFSLGDFGFDRLASVVHSQELSSDYGKIIRVNPESGTSEIVSIGHRNPQGLASDADGNLWSTEHGPQGGDELNLIRQERNYGWPYVTYGAAYGAKLWPISKAQGRHLGYERPVFAWLPSIGVSNLIIIDDFSAEWDGDLLVSSLKSKILYRIRYEQDRVVFAEPIFVGARTRDILQLPGGLLVLWTDEGTIMELRVADRNVVDTSDSLPEDLDEAQKQQASKLILECLGCHSVRPGAPETAAPSLWNVYGRLIGTSRHFANYSNALASRNGVWNDKTLDEFLRDAETFAPGNEMSYASIADEDMRRVVIDFLRSQRPKQERGKLENSLGSRLTRLYVKLKEKIGLN